MNRLGLLIIVMLSVITTAMGQVEFGVRAGGSYSSLTQRFEDSYMSGGKMGFSVAGIADIHLYKRLSLRPEIAFVNQGGSYYSQPVQSELAAYNKYRYYSIQVPVNLAFSFNLSDILFSVFAGPALDFSLFGKTNTQSNELDSDINFGIEKEKDLKRFDLGVNLGIAVEYSKFFFSIDALCGTLDRRSVERKGESSVFQNNVTFSLGYFFRK